MTLDDAEIVKAGVQGTVEGALKPFADLIQSLFGPAAAEAGLMLRDQVQSLRLRRSVRLLQKTRERLSSAGIEPRPVPLKALALILEGATLEDSDDLQDVWANLLANAADPRVADSVSPTYPLILRELSHSEVKFLDVLYQFVEDKSGGRASHPRLELIPLPTYLESLYLEHVLHIIFPNEVFGRDRDEHKRAEASRAFRFSLDVLFRHQLIEKVLETSNEIDVRAKPVVGYSYHFTSLGIGFVEACRAPEK